MVITREKASITIADPGPRVVPQFYRFIFSNINGLHGNRDELAVAASKFDVVAFAEMKVTFAWLQRSNSGLPNDLGISLFVLSLFSLVFLFRDRKGSSALVVSSWLINSRSAVILLFVCCL